MTGKVWLVGAGPSDQGLFTLRGKEVIEQADVVVYDRLVGHSILTMIPDRVKQIPVGKIAGYHPVKQTEINQILLQEAMAGKKVVRLKGGDPFLFGRGGEELELLVQHQIPFEVVPGVTSAIAVPAYNGIPVTHREYCSSVHIITGHRKGGVDQELDFQALVNTKGTLVFLMSTMALEMICDRLIAAGMDKEMPAAALQQGTSARQKKIIATVSTLNQEVLAQGIEAPAIFVFGNVCGMADQFSWYEKRPLAGKRIAVVRKKGIISVLADKLRNKGAEVLELPIVDQVEQDINAQVRDCFSTRYQWLIFTSPYSVKVWMKQMKENQIDIRKLADIKIAAIGNMTRKSLAEDGIFADLSGAISDQKNILQDIFQEKSQNLSCLIIGGQDEEQKIKETLQKICIDTSKVTYAAAYQTYYEESLSLNIIKDLQEKNIDYITFTNVIGIEGFVKCCKDIGLSDINAICIGEQTFTSAKQAGLNAYQAKSESLDEMIRLLEELE